MSAPNVTSVRSAKLQKNRILERYLVGRNIKNICSGLYVFKTMLRGGSVVKMCFFIAE